MNDAGIQEHPDDFEGATKPLPRKADWVIRAGTQVRWALIAFVVANVAALVLDFHLNRQIGSHFTPMLDGVLHVKQSVIRSHLWLREHLANDDTIGLAEVTWHLDQARATVHNVLEGRPVHLLRVTGKPDSYLQDQWRLLLDKIQNLQTSAALTIAGEARPQTGMEVPASYNDAVRDVISFADVLEATLENRINEKLSWLRRLQIVAVVIFLMLVATGAWFIHRNFRQLSLEVQRRYKAERRLERSRAKAITARDEVKVAAAAKDQLLGKVSHEVRTPINAIFGLATVIESTDLNETQRNYLRMLESETHALWRIMEDLLDLSKLESRKLSINKGVIDLRRIVADAVDLTVPEAEAKGILLDADLPSHFPPALIGDGVRIRQVILNLLSNAIKFTDEGAVEAGLRGGRLDDGRYQVSIWVSDTGMGIPPEKRQHVFDPFAQGDDTTTRRFGGTGLGLTICRELVLLMGGKIRFDDVEEGGTRFWIWLPMELAKVTMEIPPPDRLDGHRALVVDLDDGLRGRTCQLLRDMGATVQAVEDAAQAASALETAQAREEPFGATIASDRLPGGMLEQLMARIRADERLAGTDIFVVRKSSAYINRNGERENGATADVAAPYRVLELPSLMLGRQSQPRAIESAVRPAADRAGVYHGLEVLLVDDHPVMQIAGRHMLESIGCHVDSAHDGRDALRQWESKNYDVIFLDWEMPDIDGLEVARRIREQERRPLRPRSYLVAITANAMACDRKRCLEAGMDEYICKPVTRESFVRALRRFDDHRDTA